MPQPNLRNVAIIAHVDHGKTTLVDQLLYQSGNFRKEELDKLAGGQHGLILDSNDLERERGITIFSKNCAIQYARQESPDVGGGTGTAVKVEPYRINLIDTPGHADFGGEVERVLRMADGVLLVVCAFEGPMPQTRFVLQKALSHGLRPIVVVNKMDRPDARPEDVVNEVFDLLVELNAPDEALDFPVVYTSARSGWASRDSHDTGVDMRPALDAIVDHVPAPKDEVNEPLRMLVTTLDRSDYVGRIAIGRVFSGRLKKGQIVTVIKRDGKHTQQRALQVFQFDRLGRREAEIVEAGDICAVVGLESIDIGDTIACPEDPSQLDPVGVDQPTLHMTFRVNDSPFAGREGDFVTSRQIKARLDKEVETDMALRIKSGDTPEEFHVFGRGMMHLGILLENMRREGYELATGKPKVIMKDIDGKQHEPIEELVIDCPHSCRNAVMSLLGDRRAEMIKMEGKAGASEYVHMRFSIPARGLIGLRTRMLTATQGRAVMHHNFLRYERMRGAIPQRTAGVMVASEAGQVTAYALDKLYDRGPFFVKPGQQVYEGQIVGEHCKDQDIPVNVCATKKLTNIRAAGKDDASQVRPARELSLEACLEYIQDDELVEITPTSVRMRKRMLKESDRRRESRRKGA